MGSFSKIESSTVSIGFKVLGMDIVQLLVVVLGDGLSSHLISCNYHKRMEHLPIHVVLCPTSPHSASTLHVH